MSDTKSKRPDSNPFEGLPAVGWNGTELVGGDPMPATLLDLSALDWRPVRFVRVDPPKEGA
jgi:hypothetical protein